MQARTLGWRRRALTVLAVLSCLAGASAALAPTAAVAGQATIYRGHWHCDDRGTSGPLPGAEIQLWRRGDSFFPVEWVGSIVDRGHTGEDGSFALRAGAGYDDQHFVRIALRDAHGVRLKDFWGINDWSVDSEQRPNDVSARYLGLRLATPGQSHKCAIWRAGRNAHREFRDLMGFDPPSGGLLIQADAPADGVPFTPNTEIWWPGGFPTGRGGAGDDSVVRHEFGHVVRHGYDGDLGHFLGDVIEHNYLRHHGICSKTGRGFAFNEGWAAYWARESVSPPACEAGYAPDDYEVEGNVAAGLAELERTCFDGRRRPMVEILRANRGRIHSFEEFRARTVCPAPPRAPEPGTVAPPRMPEASPAARAALARTQVRALGRRVRAIRNEIVRAERRAESTPRCKAANCERVLERLTRPAVLGAELRVARAQRAAVDDFDTAREVERLGKLAPRGLIRRDAAADRRLRRGIGKAHASAIAKVVRQLRKIRGSGPRRLAATLAKARRGFLRAARGGPLPAGFGAPLPLPEMIQEVPPVEPPPPTPTPTPAPSPSPTPAPSPSPSPTPTPAPEASALTLSCPETVATGKPIEVSGELAPSHPGSEVTVTFTRGNTTDERTARLDAESSFVAQSQSMTPNDRGTWTVEATWPGDADTTGSEAGCTVQVE